MVCGGLKPFSIKTVTDHWSILSQPQLSLRALPANNYQHDPQAATAPLAAGSEGHRACLSVPRLWPEADPSLRRAAVTFEFDGATLFAEPECPPPSVSSQR